MNVKYSLIVRNERNFFKVIELFIKGDLTTVKVI